MAITIDWATKVINVPRNDMLLVQASPTEIRQLDLDNFRLELKAIEQSFEGMPYPDTHRHNTTVTVGGVTLARVIEIINGYSVTFEDGQYAVNLSGANSNVADVSNVNQVSIRSANSAGLQDISGLQEKQDYGGFVLIDSVNGAPATAIDHPWGTIGQPVDNFQDAVAIANYWKLSKIVVTTPDSTPITLDADVSHMTVESATAGVWFALAPGNDVSGTRFIRAQINGDANASSDWYGENLLLHGSLTGIRGTFWDCSIHTTDSPTHFDIQYDDNTTFHNLGSAVYGTGIAKIEKEPSVTASLQIRGLHGGLIVRGVETGSSVVIDADAAYIEIDSTTTGGDFIIRGMGEPLVVNGTTDLLDQDGYQTADNIAAAVWSNASAVTLDSRIADIFTMLGLNTASPMTISGTQHNSNDVVVTITNNNNGSFTLTRQP